VNLLSDVLDVFADHDQCRWHAYCGNPAAGMIYIPEKGYAPACADCAGIAQLELIPYDDEGP